MADDGKTPPNFAGALSVMEFAELQASLIIGLRIAGLEGVELNRAVAAAGDAVLTYRASTSPSKQERRTHLRVLKQRETPDAS